MKRHIAYFDFLGYKEFILNNDSEYLKTRVGHILVGIEQALAEGNCKNQKMAEFYQTLARQELTV